MMREYLLRAPGGARSELRAVEVERLRRAERLPRRREPEGLRADRSILCLMLKGCEAAAINYRGWQAEGRKRELQRGIVERDGACVLLILANELPSHLSASGDFYRGNEVIACSDARSAKSHRRITVFSFLVFGFAAKVLVVDYQQRNFVEKDLAQQLVSDRHGALVSRVRNFRSHAGPLSLTNASPCCEGL